MSCNCTDQRIVAAVQAERDRCAKIADDLSCENRWECDYGHNHGEEIAAKIRSGE